MDAIIFVSTSSAPADIPKKSGEGVNRVSHGGIPGTKQMRVRRQRFLTGFRSMGCVVGA